jgi:hypothetical protein
MRHNAMASSAATMPKAHGKTCLATSAQDSLIQAPLMPCRSSMMTWYVPAFGIVKLMAR